MTEIQQIFSLLAGTWIGEGRGEFPGVTSFDFRATFLFTRRDDKSLAYSQQAEKRYEGQTEWLVSHWESGFVRILENGELELISAQIGRSEILIGSVELLNNNVRIHFVSKTIANDPRMIS
ncbi:MAG TPA: FABP family protein, partial [Anaerolineales bacterium]